MLSSPADGYLNPQVQKPLKVQAESELPGWPQQQQGSGPARSQTPALSLPRTQSGSGPALFCCRQQRQATLPATGAEPGAASGPRPLREQAPSGSARTPRSVPAPGSDVLRLCLCGAQTKQHSALRARGAVRFVPFTSTSPAAPRPPHSLPAESHLQKCCPGNVQLRAVK